MGLNTESPKAILDIKAKDQSNASTTNEGLLIPQVSRLRAANMANPSVSTLIYINTCSAL